MKAFQAAYEVFLIWASSTGVMSLTNVTTSTINSDLFVSHKKPVVSAVNQP